MNRYELRIESDNYAVFTDNEGTVIAGSYNIVMEYMTRLLNNNDDRMSQLEQSCNDQCMKLDLIKKISNELCHFPRKKYKPMYVWEKDIEAILSYFINQDLGNLHRLYDDCKRLVRLWNNE